MARDKDQKQFFKDVAATAEQTVEEVRGFEENYFPIVQRTMMPGYRAGPWRCGMVCSPMGNPYGITLDDASLRWAAAEGVPESVIVAICLLGQKSVDEIVAKLTTAELGQVITIVGRSPVDKKIRHVGARDEPGAPVALIDQYAIRARARPGGQDSRANDRPVETAPAYDPLLGVLVG